MIAQELEVSLHMAFVEARQKRHEFITVEHLLLALLDNPSAAEALRACGASIDVLRRDLNKFIAEHTPTVAGEDEIDTQPTLGFQRVIQRAILHVQSSGKKEVNGANVLVAIFGEKDSHAVYYLQKQGVTRLDVVNFISHGISKVPQQKAPTEGETETEGEQQSNAGPLENYTLNLNAMALAGKIDPLIGRDKELERVIQTLCRRRKNNPLLVGEAGVGKTAIAEGLARRIVEGDIPEILAQANVYALDMGALLAGTKYRGDFEQRLKSVLKQLQENPNAVLFIDEIHTLIGAGAASGGTLDASNLLKPALSSGQLKCIGATTYTEYRGIFEKDHALSRRFQKIDVSEPSVAETVEILKGLKPRFEAHHGIKYSASALTSAVELSVRFINDRHLPDKAIDLIDEAAARIKMEIDSKPESMDKLDRRIIQLKIEREAVKKERDEASIKRFGLIEDEIAKLQKEYSDLEEIWKAEKAAVHGSAHIKEEIEKVKLQMAELQRQGAFDKLAELQYGKLPGLEAQLKAAEKAGDGEVKNKLLRTQVGAEEIAEVVSRATGIPVSKMMQGERDKLLKMEDKLHQRVVGQDEAVRLVADAIRRSRAGLSDPNKPYGSFLFLGPTGVGKTELCKALAEFMFDSEEHLIRIDMSEFMEKHSVARLIGAPPGYVGYGKGGILTEAVRRKPYSVILLDEVEKAHPDVFNVLLQVLDDGRMTDGQGRTVDFKNTVIVMTSNLGSQMIQSMAGTDYGAVKVAVMAEVKTYFRPEFINRIDEVVVFHSLDEKNIASIAKIQLGYLEKRLAQMEMGLVVDDSALLELAKAGFDPVFGARPLKRAIQQQIENPLAKAILEGKFGAKDTVRVGVIDGSLRFARG